MDKNILERIEALEEAVLDDDEGEEGEFNNYDEQLSLALALRNPAVGLNPYPAFIDKLGVHDK